MSTDFFAVCEDCLANNRHFHRRSDVPVIHRFFGGVDKGVQFDVDTTLLGDKEFVVDESGNLHKVSALLATKGLGK